MKCQPRSGGIFRKSKKVVEKAHGVFTIFPVSRLFNDREKVKLEALRTDLLTTSNYFLIGNVTIKLAKIISK